MALPKLYEQIVWHNNTSPALNEDNLNSMSQTIDDIDDRVIELAGTIMEDVPEIREDLEILRPAIESIEENVEAAAESAEASEASALKSEGYAIGEQDGVEVGPDSEYYQKNAKYYAEIANPPIENTVDFTDIITISDAINKAAKDVRLKIEAVQDLHGYNNPWVGGAGKNKLILDLAAIKANNTSGTWNGNVYSISNGTITVLVDSNNNVVGIKVNGTFNADITFLVCNYNVFLSTGSYVFGCGEHSDQAWGGWTNSYIGFINNVNGVSSWINSDGTKAARTINITDSTKGIRFALYIQANQAINNLTCYPMIRLASITDDIFEPYANICPISGWDNAKVTRSGKNLLENNLTSGTTQASVVATVQSDKKVVLNGLATGDAIFVLNNHCVLPKGLLKLTGNPSKGYLSALKYNSSGYMGVVYNDSGSGVIMDTSNDADDVYYVIRIVVYVLTGQLTNATYEPMISIEGGEYEPYKETVETTISLNGTRYGGTLDVTSGVLTLDKGYELLDGSSDENFTLAGGGYRVNYINSATIIKKPPTNGSLGEIISDKFPTTTAGNTYVGVFGVSVDTAGGVGFSLNPPMTVENFRTWLASNNTQICYSLATPTTVQLTPTQVYLLYGYNTLFGDCGDILLTYDASGIIHIEEAKLDTETLKTIAAASSDFADFKARIAGL